MFGVYQPVPELDNYFAGLDDSDDSPPVYYKKKRSFVHRVSETKAVLPVDPPDLREQNEPEEIHSGVDVPEPTCRLQLDREDLQESSVNLGSLRPTEDPKNALNSAEKYGFEDSDLILCSNSVSRLE